MGPKLVEDQMQEIWDMNFVCLYPAPQPDGTMAYSGVDKLEEYLKIGYEPFAISMVSKMPAKAGLLTGAKEPPLIGDKVWLRRKDRIKIEPPVGTSPKTS